jgi:ribosome biogenesis protein ENP2
MTFLSYYIIGKHAKLRVPKFGRELGYYPANSELLVACAGSELYRLSLEEGRFLSPYTTAMNDINSIAVSDDHYLVTLGRIKSKKDIKRTHRL